MVGPFATEAGGTAKKQASGRFADATPRATTLRWCEAETACAGS